VFRVSALLVSVAVVVTGVLVLVGGLVDHGGLGGARSTNAAEALNFGASTSAHRS
jgi:hypothetical protein